MTRLPVIVGFGGINAAGRSSFHHGYRRMVIDSLPDTLRQETLVGLATLMKLVSFADGDYHDPDGKRYSAAEVAEQFAEQIFRSTLIRRIECFDDTAVPGNQKLEIGGSFSFTLPTKQLPQPLPLSWAVTPGVDDKHVTVTVTSGYTGLVETHRDLAVKSAGQLPTGFDPADCYNSRTHPRGLQMAVVAASDAVNSIGIPWQTIVDAVSPDEIGVFAASGMSQLDDAGNGGMMQARLKGDRVTARNLPLGLNTMPADFVNAYVLGSVGVTSAVTGACASFLFNLRLAVDEIRSGRRRVVVVGCSEAPVTPEIIDGYATMGALATAENLRKLDAADAADGAARDDFQRSSRPFGENCGFTIAESAQYVVLMDDALALQLGADIHGAIGEVFVNADGYKKSIPGPGAGNYITMAKAVASARAVLGDEAVRQRSLVQAHGSSTPQNRVTESEILDRVARCFGICDWPVAAVKAYVGHPLAPASGDQLMATLGIFRYGIIPGIKTVKKIADDVHDERLRIPLQDVVEPPGQRDLAFLNSKGFGGNNATATVFAPHVVERMLKKRYGEAEFSAYLQRRTATRGQAQAYDEAACRGDLQTIYQFGENMIDESAISLTPNSLSLPGFAHPIALPGDNPFSDMC